MRIIDKNVDFYDYLQDPTDNLVFDRRGSLILTKEIIRNLMDVHVYGNSRYRFLLLQCGPIFWLFLITVTSQFNTGLTRDYDIELLTEWKNYDKPNQVLRTDYIKFNNLHKMCDRKTHKITHSKILENIQDLIDSINRNDYTINFNLTRRHETDPFPLLKACGFSNLIDPQTIFYAIEEYFSIEKTKLETTEAKGITAEDKIIMHGFDVKTSFRKRNNKDDYRKNQTNENF